jgi:hypothetical protein
MNCNPAGITLDNFIHFVTGFPQASRANWTSNRNLGQMKMSRFYINIKLQYIEIKIFLNYIFPVFLVLLFH